MKKYLILILCFLSLLLFLSCNTADTEDGKNIDTSTPQTEKYIVKFITNTDKEVPFRKQNKGTRVVFPNDIEKTGYVLDGWYSNGEKWIDEACVTENITLEAKWIPIEYKITYIDGEGIVKKYTIEDEVELSCIEEEDFFFLGWTKELNGTELYNKIEKGTTGNITLYASKVYFGCIFTEKDDGTYEISDHHKLSTERIEYIKLPSTYKGKPVTSIGEKAFYGLRLITTMEIPSSIKKIGEQAFYNTHIDKIILQEGVEQIGKKAFSSSELKEIVLADSITIIDDFAFDYCTKLTKANIPESLEYLGQLSFFACRELSINVVIPKGVLSIEAGAFSECKKIKSVKLHENIEYIKDTAFSRCTSLTEIEIFSGLIDIYAFNNCVALEKLVVHNEVTKISNYAFSNCGLKEIIIYQGVEIIEQDAFFNVHAPIYTDATAKPLLWQIDVMLNYNPDEQTK